MAMPDQYFGAHVTSLGHAPVNGKTLCAETLLHTDVRCNIIHILLQASDLCFGIGCVELRVVLSELQHLADT